MDVTAGAARTVKALPNLPTPQSPLVTVTVRGALESLVVSRELRDGILHATGAQTNLEHMARVETQWHRLDSLEAPHNARRMALGCAFASVRVGGLKRGFVKAVGDGNQNEGQEHKGDVP